MAKKLATQCGMQFRAQSLHHLAANHLLMREQYAYCCTVTPRHPLAQDTSLLGPSLMTCFVVEIGLPENS